MIAENVRKSEEVLGDIHSFVAANALGAERLLAFMDEYGMHDLRALAQVVQGRAEQAIRERDPRVAGRGVHARRSGTIRSGRSCAIR